MLKTVQQVTEDVLKALKANPVIVNDHNTGGHFDYDGDKVRIGILTSGKNFENEYIVLVLPYEVHCLNAVYVGDDGLVHVSEISVGGNVYADVEGFNEEHSTEALKKKKIDPRVIGIYQAHLELVA